MKYHYYPSLSAATALAMLSLLCLTDATCHVDDESGLLAFKSGITADPSGILATWQRGTDCCKWNGVDCRGESRVKSLSVYGDLDTPNKYLSGTISPSLSKLKSLDSFYLMDLRNLSGPFPEFLFKLPLISYVYIENAGLSGPIPVNLGNLNRLVALGLIGNRFTGPIPSSISQLTELVQLRLSGNRLTGRVTLGMRTLKNLTSLSLDQNRLSGSIPEFFGTFSQLRSLTLSHNRFSGKIPDSLSRLAPRLRFLELGDNALTGTIPEFLGKFKALDTLDLSRNKLTGTVPKSFANLTKIFNLDLSRNGLVEPFPALNVKGIESLDLSYNSFNLKTIPKWVTSSTIIYSLKLAKCGIKMRMEDWKPVETYFYDFIDLSENEISGSPVSLLNKTDYLVGFLASGNKLKFDLEKMKIVQTLKNLDLSRNLVFGKVPKAVAGLESLNVSSNHLCGKIPATKFPASAFEHNDCLCGSPLPACKA